MKNRKIAILAPNCPPLTAGGVGTAHYTLFLFLRSQGYEISFFTFGDMQGANSVPDSDNDVVRFPLPRWYSRFVDLLLKCLWRFFDKGKIPVELGFHLRHILGSLVVRYRLKKYAPDVVILPDRGCPGFWVKRVGAAKMLHVSHHNPSRFRNVLFRGAPSSEKDIAAALWMERKAMRYVDKVICPSNYMAACFRATFGRNMPVAVIPNILEMSGMDIPAAPLRSLLRVSPDCPIVFIPDNSSPLKGERYVFEIVRRLHAAAPEVAFYLPGPVSDIRMEELNTLTFRDKIHMPGKLPYAEHLAFLRACSLCVSPSLTENYSMALAEACIYAMPAVAFDVGGNRDIVADDITGCLVSYLDVDGLIAKSIELLRDQERRTRLGQAAREKITSDMEKAREDVLHLIETL